MSRSTATAFSLVPAFKSFWSASPGAARNTFGPLSEEGGVGGAGDGGWGGQGLASVDHGVGGGGGEVAGHVGSSGQVLCNGPTVDEVGAGPFGRVLYDGPTGQGLCEGPAVE